MVCPLYVFQLKFLYAFLISCLISTFFALFYWKLLRIFGKVDHNLKPEIHMNKFKISVPTP
jgi:hypothetical protein